MQHIVTDLAKYAKDKFLGHNVKIVYPLENQANVYVYCDINKITENDIIDIGLKYGSDEFKVEILIPEKILQENGNLQENTERVDIALIFTPPQT